MRRMQVYLPNDLYEAVKKRDLRGSKLLQEAVRAEVRRRELVAASRKYTAELKSQVSAPTSRERARAETLARRIAARRSQRKAV